MRKMTAILAGAVALSFAAPALAAPKGTTAKVAIKKGKGVLKWLSSRFRNVAVRIKKKIGAARWANLRKIWREKVRAKVKQGQGRRMRAFIKFARKFASKARTGKLKKFLKKLKLRR